MTQPDRITATPDPVQHGQALKICYNFTGTGLTSAELTLDYDPPVPTQKITVTAANPCQTVTVPDAATGLIISAPQSQDHGVTIT
jgi:hypothetical protein